MPLLTSPTTSMSGRRRSSSRSPSRTHLVRIQTDSDIDEEAVPGCATLTNAPVDEFRHTRAAFQPQSTKCFGDFLVSTSECAASSLRATVAARRGSDMSSEEANKAVVRRFYAEMDAGNLEAMDELVAEDYIDHNPPPFPGVGQGRAGLKQVLRSSGRRLLAVTRSRIRSPRATRS